MYNPTNQYRCTIIRGKSQTDMENFLPLYANMVHTICPCEETHFKSAARKMLSNAIFSIADYDSLTLSHQKTVNNHLTEIAGTLMGLYYPKYEDDGNVYIYESEACKFLVENNDYPIFFQNLCLNFQFPNGAKWMEFIQEDIANNINIKPFCYVVSLLYYAQQQPTPTLLSKQEVGYYVLNNLDVLQGKVPCKDVYDRIIKDREQGVRREKLTGSRDWQHIKEQFNLLELANIVETDSTYIWLNKQESYVISIFLKRLEEPGFDCYKYDLTDTSSHKEYIADWKEYYGMFNQSLLVSSSNVVEIIDKEKLSMGTPSMESTVDLGDRGEALVYKMEQDRVRAYKPRLVNKVLLLGKTRGLGYDISSIEADENPQKPEFARYIEVKSTKRITKPSFDKHWFDSLNLTAKEWIAAEQYGDYYNIYRVYFTKQETIVVRINNPFSKASAGLLEVYPTMYQMNFGSEVIDKTICLQVD